MLGFIAKNGQRLGSGAPAPMLSVEGTAQGFINPVKLVTVLAPYEGSCVPQVSADCEESGNIIRLRVTVDGETYHMAIDASLLRDSNLKGAAVGEVGGVNCSARAAVAMPDGSVQELG